MLFSLGFDFYSEVILLTARGKVVDVDIVVMPLGMRLDRKYRTQDAEGANSVFSEVVERREHCVGIQQTETTQLLQRVRPAHSADRGGRSCGELAGLIEKLTAET